jgi:hypothetical protein
VKKIIGPLIFVLVALLVGAWQWFGKEDATTKPQTPESATVSVYLGGEKAQYLENPEVKELLGTKYGITLNATKAGSIEMVTGLSTDGIDALWPSNQIAVDMFRNRGGRIEAEQNMFNSPIVLYTYNIVADALIAHGIVEVKNGSFYVVDFLKLIDLVVEKKQWKEIGLPELYGNVAIFSTDPRRSNSGNMFCGLLANMFNGGATVTADTVNEVLPRVKDYFARRGYMEHSSGDIFKNFITTGVGAKPIIVGYENQLVEFSIQNEKYNDYLREKIRTLYPIPTMWSSHPIIALNKNGKRLIEAFKDEKLQKIAWETHGFRSGLMGVENDPAVLKVTGIPKDITAVIPMPETAVMEKILQALETGG